MATVVVQKRTNWADDDSSTSGSVHEPLGSTTTRSETSSGHSGGGPKFKVWYKKHPTTYARILYDVEGHALVDENNNPVNVFTAKMKEMLEKGQITCHHKPGRPGYRYFTTYKGQADIFKKARQRGFWSSVGPFHVYPDEPGCILPHEDGTPTAL